MKQGQSDDSLELLLDTVSNVFGGVMFLILLVALMSITRASTSRQDEPVQSPDPPSMELLTEFTKLQETRRVQTKLLESMEVTDESVQHAEDLADATSDLAKLRASLTAEAAAVEHERANLDSMAEQITRLKGQIEEDAKQVTLRSKELAERVRKNSREVTFSPARVTRKSEDQWLLRYGRVYTVWRNRVSKQPNLSDLFAFKADDGSIDLTPKPYRGLPVQSPAFASGVADMLRRYDRSTTYLAIVVWADSFREFESVKRALISARFEYRLMTLKDGETIHFSNVENPLVN